MALGASGGGWWRQLALGHDGGTGARIALRDARAGTNGHSDTLRPAVSDYPRLKGEAVAKGGSVRQSKGT